MKSKNIFVIALAIASLLVTPTFAACTNVCSTENQYSCTKSISTLTKGTSSTLTVTITNKQQNSVSSLSAQLLGSWFTASSATTTISSMQGSGGTANADFSITPTATGGQDVCVALGSTCTADCGTVTINSAAELSVTSMTAPSSVSASSSFTVSATIQNAGTETAGSTSSVTATLSSSQCTVSSATKTVGTIAGSGTNSVSWTVTAPSSGSSCTLSLSVSGTPGGTATGSKSVTVTGGTSSSSSSSTGAGGGAGAAGTTPAGTKVTVTKGKATITIPFIAANKSALVEITKSEETNVNKISIAIRNAVNNLMINIEKVTEKPSEVSVPTGKVYHYLKIEKINLTDGNVNSATIDFQIEKAWISGNNIDDSTVALNRFSNNQWNKLATTKLREDASYVYYSAQSPGLSVFAITAAEKAVTATTVTTPAAATTTTAAAGKPSEGKPADNSIFVLLAGFVIVFALAFFLVKKKGKHSIV